MVRNAFRLETRVLLRRRTVKMMCRVHHIELELIHRSYLPLSMRDTREIHLFKNSRQDANSKIRCKT